AAHSRVPSSAISGRALCQSSTPEICTRKVRSPRSRRGGPRMTASATCEKARPQLLRRSRKRRSPRRHTRTAGGCGKRTKSPNRRAIALPPDEGDFLCADWVWDAALRELRNYPRKGKRHADEPQAVERLKPVRSVTWHRWSQAPMQTATGHVLPPSLSRVAVAY